MTVLITGAGGMLATDMEKVFKTSFETISFSIEDLDITQPEKIDLILEQYPNTKYLINCAAYTNVDGCEKNRKEALAVNGTGTKNLAFACKKKNIHFIHFSTDYVFDGTIKETYKEDDLTNPINYYGESKLCGENHIRNINPDHYIFRIQWLYGLHGNNFLHTIVKASETKNELTIVNDQFGTPSWTYDISEYVLGAIKANIPNGTYHLRNEGFTNWNEFSSCFLKILNKNTKIISCSSDKFPRPAARPKNSKLNIDKFTKASGITPKHWKKAVEIYIKEYFLQ